MYGEKFGVMDDRADMGLTFKSKDDTKKEKIRNRKVSEQTSSQVSPIRRKDSVGKRDKYVK